MFSFVLMAAMATAPEANANVFKRHQKACTNCAAPACSDCGAAPCDGCSGTAPAATTPATPTTPPKDMPKGEPAKTPVKTDVPKTKVDAPKGDKAVEAPKAAPKAEAPIEIPAKLKEAIDKNDQKTKILEYLGNTSVPREKRIQYLETVRQTLLPDEKK